MKKFFLVIILITSCARHEVSELKSYEKIDFDNDYTISEFVNLLELYNNIIGYPNINN